MKGIGVHVKGVALTRRALAWREELSVGRGDGAGPWGGRRGIGQGLGVASSPWVAARDFCRN